jgi:NAD(P)-dependent dehydrogenase (short-subunit alcohol dehydrogenase family)
MAAATQPLVGLVTGGGSGIGRASAIALARRGYAVVVADLRAAEAAQTAAAIADTGGRSEHVQVDVTNEAQVKAAVEYTVAQFGHLDAAVNSAGIQGQLAPAGECTVENWEQTLAVNLTGTWLCLREQLGVMVPRGSGSIVNISSNFGLVGKQEIPAYCAAKHGVIGLTKSAALDYAPYGIRINAVCPGPTDTPMLLGDRKAIEANVPMGRAGTADEVGAAVAWLCSAESTFVTGTAFPVDGGFVVR